MIKKIIALPSSTHLKNPFSTKYGFVNITVKFYTSYRLRIYDGGNKKTSLFVLLENFRFWITKLIFRRHVNCRSPQETIIFLLPLTS